MFRTPIRLAAAITRWFLYALAAVLVLIAIALAAVETGWAKEQIRALIVREANQYLTATLEIGRLEGSLFRGLRLGDVKLSREGATIVSIDDISLSYSIRELIERGTVIRSIRLVRPQFAIAKQADGRWNLGALVKRETRQNGSSGPGRPIHILAIEIADGTVALADPLTFGAARVPSQFNRLNAQFTFDYVPVTWNLAFSHASWEGIAGELTVNNLSGGIANGRDGWGFSKLLVETPRSRFILDGRVDRRVTPTVLDLDVNAERFAFQEWAGVLGGLKNIAIDGRFHAVLKGPFAKLATTIDLDGTGGGVTGSLVLDTTVPGWRGVGGLDVRRLDMAHWLNRDDRPTDISGHVDFDLDLRLGKIPTGKYTFNGSHAGFMDYQADDIRARGNLTATEVRIAEVTATAYGANVRVDAGTIGTDSPYPFSFTGVARGVDLRQVPKAVPVPHVESVLSFDYQVTGQFSESFIIGRAAFDPSRFLDATLAAGASGSVDTSVQPFHYEGQGDLTNIDLHRFGVDLGIDWLQEPRYAGTVAGRFHVDGSGSDAATMVLSGGGRIDQADLFGGRLTGAEVSIALAAGSLTGSYDGQLEKINPALALDDPRFDASLTGTGQARIEVRDMLIRSPQLADYRIEGGMTLAASTIRRVAIQSAEIRSTLIDGTLNLHRLRLLGPSIDLDAGGNVEFDGVRSTTLDYTLRRASLSLLKDLTGREIAGELATTGRLTGPTTELHVAGHGTLTQLDAFGVTALSTTADYDVTVPTDAPRNLTATLKGRATFVEGFNQHLQQISGTVAYTADQHASLDLEVSQREGITGHLTGAFVLHQDDRRVEINALTMAFRRGTWRLASAGGAQVSWDDGAITVTQLAFADANASQHITVDGSWRANGGGTLKLAANGVFLDTFAPEGQQPVRYGGLVDLEATLSGSKAAPIVNAQVSITKGRIRRLGYEKLAGRVGLSDGMIDLDLRLDQAPGVWLTVGGSLPLGVLDRTSPDRAMDVTVRSSDIGLTVIEGVTDVVREVNGQLRVNVRAVGSSRDPHFDGSVEITGAAFLVTGSGARYRNGRTSLTLSKDLIAVESLHIEDRDGHPLDIKGSLGTHELRVGELEIDATARQFEVLRNEFGRMAVDADLHLRGQLQAPRVAGKVTVSGGDISVDTIIDRALFRPYVTEQVSITTIEDDAIVALNPWDRLGLEIELNVPNTLRLTGDNVQVTPGTPLGLGNINLRVLGDLYLYKDPGGRLDITGSFDQVTGTYAFQGRRFDLDPVSSINFHGDLNPELFVTVTRVISGVETRVTIAGSLEQPELRLASTPPLDASDILSLIVFNTSTNDLSALQQQQLAVRAGTLAAGFLAAPMLSALERSLGISTLEIEPAVDNRGGTRVTIGDELAPGLVARFSRQFGSEEYDEATLEYYLSNILRIRATFSDAGELVRSPFRRVERAGIDLLMFFSF